MRKVPLDDIQEEAQATHLGEEGDFDFEALHLYEVIGMYE